MIRLRAEWHHTCLECGTRVVVDFLADPNGYCICPWCGKISGDSRGPRDSELRARVSQTLLKLEDRTNASIPAP